MLALEQALEIIQSQDTWDVDDDLCDCVFQRIGYWNNPYIGETLEVRLCCVWAEIEKAYPQWFRRTTIEPAAWDGEADMPRSIYHRQVANLEGVSLPEARLIAGDAPRGKPRTPKATIYLRWGSEWLPMEFA